MVSDPEMIEFVEMKMLDLLTHYGCDGERVPLVKGSSLYAPEGRTLDPLGLGNKSILQLLDVIDEQMPNPERSYDKRFLMPLEDIFSIFGRKL